MGQVVKAVWNKVDKLNIRKLGIFPVDLSMVTDEVKTKLLKRVNKYNAKTNHIEDKIPVITNLATNTTLNAKINCS